MKGVWLSVGLSHCLVPIFILREFLSVGANEYTHSKAIFFIGFEQTQLMILTIYGIFCIAIPLLNRFEIQQANLRAMRHGQFWSLNIVLLLCINHFLTIATTLGVSASDSGISSNQTDDVIGLGVCTVLFMVTATIYLIWANWRMQDQIEST